ncbi:hypothetical protein Pcinc_029491 [Petrolisthes cinctipes]|uniref:Uncharacterized protein n=1 Tax=Petrolisthes cinctipes TaxID=88211 RepID=A0AAE1K7R0_PETCI|nr:hypothetical protein Pcinc_029491 [Petrolisthes cinctipes]
MKVRAQGEKEGNERDGIEVRIWEGERKKWVGDKYGVNEKGKEDMREYEIKGEETGVPLADVLLVCLGLQEGQVSCLVFDPCG